MKRLGAFLKLLVGTEPDLAGWPLWMVPTAGGAPRRVGDLRASPLPPSAALSPDGRRIAFVDGSANRLVIAGLDGTVVQTITPLPDSAFEPQWSPDGSRLRLTARGPKGHESELWKWEVTLGTTRDQAPFPLWFELGAQNLGGTLATAGGVVFIGATTDKFVRAFDAETGEALWKFRTPYTANATPMTFRLRKNGKQFVVIAAGGHGWSEPGDALMAFALPGELK